MQYTARVWSLGVHITLMLGLTFFELVSGIGGRQKVLAQIQPDTSLGSESSVLIPGVDIIQGGAVRGINLFHSFSDFSIEEGRSVYFSNPTGIENIITRVTGNNRSEILGILGVLGKANLFLINPNGIVFGQNAQLDIAGSFVASTADSISFSNGLVFSAKSPQANPLLSVNVPLGLQFGSQPGDIKLHGASLSVTDDKTLAFVGGNVSLDGTSLLSLGGRIELGGLLNSGTVGLDLSNNHLQLQFPDVERADVSLVNRANVNADTVSWGSININARNLQILEDSQLNALNDSSADAQGNILINATNSILLNGTSSAIGSLVTSLEGGTGANLIINTSSLTLVNGAQIYTVTAGQKKGGNIYIHALDSVSLDGLGFDSDYVTGIASQALGQGNSGDLILVTDKLSLTNGAQMGNLTVGTGNLGDVTIVAKDSVSLSGISILGSIVGTDGQGDAGKLSISTKSLLVTDGGQILTVTAGNGNAGNMEIIAKDVKFDSGGIRNLDTGAFSRVEPGAIGKGGEINITADSLSLQNLAQIDASTFGEGQSGNISITSQTLLVNNGAQISAGTVGQGNAANIIIYARDSAIFDGAIAKENLANGIVEYVPSGVFTSVVAGAVGKGGNFTINTGKLAITNGAELSSSTSGQGDAGNIAINAKNSILIDGFRQDGNRSSIVSAVNTGAIGNGGTIKLTTPTMSVTNGAFISSSTEGLGNAGNIEVVADTFTAASGGRLLSSTNTNNNAGDISLRVRDRITLADSDTGIFANTFANAGGNSGNIFIDPKVMIIRDGAKIAVDNQGSGIGGNIDIQAGQLILNNQAVISGETASNTGGNINLELQDWLSLRRGSVISTSAGTTQAGGDGGNINIKSPFIFSAPLENNDITANAFTGNGGRVNITTKTIFGLRTRTRADLEQLLATKDPKQLDPRSLPTNDITAISQANPSLNGQILINRPDVDPGSGLVALPANVVDASQLIAQNCQSSRQGTASKQSEFVVTGRGGLPSNPRELLSSDAIWQDLQAYVLLNESSHISQQTSSVAQLPDPIVEAQGWVTGANGQITLVAQAPMTTPHNSSLSPVSCPVAQN
ncbi:filamentous hemagglutinin N-terminal domain-containing protein [Nostoc sp. MS1]|uniref:two-partner secretion domain-containing protein n=1 Tax=Nostoc sp. MS1 TaxID=2764711 RepID=UPI001CC6AA9F|nr:S-layer family protein [Nostoc sp. MS1]BCL39066.1 hypothetical protein NSMS1_55130 [Nostoc sp. MS1]